jgi:ribonuclease VapC
VDASAIVAIVSLEPEHAVLARRLDEADAPITSGLAMFEAVTAIVRKKGLAVSEALEIVQEMLTRTEIDVVEITAETASSALGAFAQFGKGRGHKAQLNLCDCFAYAMAKQHGVPLLYKGDDFAHTDLA